MAAPDNEPVALRIPAILQNPVNRTQKQVEAHNAQQREKVEAKRERVREVRYDTGSKGDKRGKRVIRRSDNAAFASNPHIVRPSRSDYAPPFPMMSHPPLPLDTLPRSTAIPPADLPAKDPFSTSSVNGTFSTSIKGIRQALRKKGRRTEVVVQKVEDGIRSWLSGQGVLSNGDDCEESKWTVIDDTLLEDHTEVLERESSGTAHGHGQSSTSGRRIPQQYRVEHGSTPPLPVRDDLVPAILELSRSAGHLTWLAIESFERLVVHLICRYYEVVSFSEDHVTTSGQKVRLTHIIRPAVVNPRPLPTGSLVTPDNSDLSAPSSSDLSSSSGTETETDSDTATEIGESIPDSDLDDETQGYTVPSPQARQSESAGEDVGLRSPTLESAMNELQVSELALRRTFSNSSSQYAESEGGSDFGMADSLTLPPAPSAQAGRGWVSTFDSGPIDLGAPPAPAGNAGPRRTPAVGPAAAGRLSWQDKPTFFEYLYGA